MKRIIKTLATIFVLAAISLPLSAQVEPGTPVTGEVEGRFLGTIIANNGNGVYVAAVAMEGAFKSGVPFEGLLMLDIETPQTLRIDEPIRGRVRAQVFGAIDEYSDAGLKFSVEASEVDYEWQTIQNFGSGSKGGGTNIFQLELADIIFSVAGSVEGNDI